ncbi:MAG: BBP7 family outer membrane beta-barrel protein [Pirellulales bacterium]|nr:BBP7 family outer membrane beta-barrel protein [Pirellulales bacterium]
MTKSLVLAAAIASSLGPAAAGQAQSVMTGDAPVVTADEYVSGAAPGIESTPYGGLVAAPEVFAPYDPYPASGSACSSCGGGGAAGFFNRCGCNTALFPYIEGPGRCDNWCVGPHLQVELDGIVLTRDRNDWAPFTALAGVAPDFTDTFDVAAGARLFVTGYNCHGYGLQVGYEGVNDFTGYASYSVAGDTRTFDYESNYNSLEINFIPATQTSWRVFGGVRYVEIDENLEDRLTVAKALSPPVSGPSTSGPFIDEIDTRMIDNRLIGFQIGTFRDAWNLNRWLSFEAFANTGVYLNNQRVRTRFTTFTTVYTIDDIDTPENEFSEASTSVTTGTKRNFTDTAFTGEAGAALALRLNPCFALRAGYQVLVVDRVGLAANAFPIPDYNGETLLYHGLQFGMEYRR